MLAKLRLQTSAKVGGEVDQTRRSDAVESHSRTRSRRFVVAFAFIIAVTIADMVQDGPSIWNWLGIVVCGGFLLQQVYRLTSER